MPDLAWDTDVRLARDGDREAFSRLVREFSGEMYRMARTLLRSDEDCADALQEAILQAYRGVTKLREPDFFKTWMMRILIRECQRIGRRRSVSLSEVWAEESAEMTMPDLDLRAAVGRLDEPLRTLVRLHYLADVPLNRLAEWMDIPEGTLKSRLHRARKQLAVWLEDTEERGMGYELH
ncbi:sigma-70 family RNA polymerase sigma factor [Cohnella nanjingensis]|uniref:Sigma-70 family RNA polymerase sigma factor n=1 Tax=Cohnella nanjingensis TaxID=1387779 RepID=A0A7X0RRX7_9BACL|nr:sigma-70 family RNA polymerase sigma factor [Cohnella nanjingensis]MBB6672358.1 sigma-70 family RNA polymerase sigma factor [Cohnella nanjingensis]